MWEYVPLPDSFLGGTDRANSRASQKSSLFIAAATYIRTQHTLAHWATSHESFFQGRSEEVWIEIIVNIFTENYKVIGFMVPLPFEVGAAIWRFRILIVGVFTYFSFILPFVGPTPVVFGSAFVQVGGLSFDFRSCGF